MSSWSKGWLGGAVAAGVALTGALDPSIAAANERAPPSAVRMQVLGSLHGMASFVTVYANGDYAIASPGKGGTVIRSDVEADVDGRVLKSSAYPQHTPAQAEFQDELGSGSLLTVTHTGLAGAPDLVCALRLYRDQAWGDIVVHVVNTTDRALSVQAIRTVHASDAPVIDLGGVASADRILSDSYSEDRPQLAIRELGDARQGMHRAVGSQLIYQPPERRKFVSLARSPRSGC